MVDCSLGGEEKEGEGIREIFRDTTAKQLQLIWNNWNWGRKLWKVEKATPFNIS